MNGVVPARCPPSGSRATADGLRIGGLTPWTSIDFPGRLAAVVFCQGCPWRCGYCHNPQLLPRKGPATVSWHEVHGFLQKRRGLLDAVVFSGGEPTMQPALLDAMEQVRELGFATGLHTGGMFPDRIGELLPRLDWIGLDIKAPWHRLDELTRSARSAARVKSSLDRVLASGVPHECRTTWHPALFPFEELCLLADQLAGLGVSQWALQQCRIGSAGWALSDSELSALSSKFPDFILRRL